jgi:L-asparaginase II
VSALPLFETTRGDLVESVHHGSIAVVDSNGKLIASYGDPHAVAFLRSSAKPFQALPFVENGGVEHYNFTLRELSISCASHEGSDMHVQTVEGMQKKIGIDESLLQCGVHMPGDVDAFKSLIVHNRLPEANRNNCSGKHTAMLAHAKMRGLPLENYLDINHPIQQDILASFSDMCMIPSEQVYLGIDGCSAPNFAVPLYNAAYGIARFCDPHKLPSVRAEACNKIIIAMTSHPEMVSGYGEFDCELMKAGEGTILCKRGAEGFQVVGIMPGVLGKDLPGLGIAFKVSDGDASRRDLNLETTTRVRPSVTIEILRQLCVLSSKKERSGGHLQQALGRFRPGKPIQNHRGIVTGRSYPVFKLSIF